MDQTPSNATAAGIRRRPPRPKAAIRIGFARDRGENLPPQLVGNELQAVLRLVREEAASLVEGHSWAFSASPPVFHFVSPLTDEVDLAAAAAARAEGFRLMALLPDRRGGDGSERIRADEILSGAEATIEFDPDQGAPAERLLRAEALTIVQSDILIVMTAEAHAPSGALEAVGYAVKAGKHVVWIALRKKPGAEALRNEVRDALIRILAPPAADEIGFEIAGEHTGARKAYREFLNERDATFNFGLFYQFVERLLTGRSLLRLKASEPSLARRLAEERSAPLIDVAAPSAKAKNILDDLIAERFAWADLLATHYGSIYRSGYFFSYLASAAAVLFALISLITPSVGAPLWISLVAAAILSVMAVTIGGRRGRWHEKWIDYRHLAEELRHFRRFFLATGSGYDPGEDGREIGGGWVDWYLRAAVREAGMADVSFTPEGIRQASRAIVEHDLRPQVAYHKQKAATLRRIEHRLHRLGESAFGATLAVCAVYLAAGAIRGSGSEAAQFGGGLGDWLSGPGRYWVIMLAGFLPALGAAFIGIRVQGEFGSTAERSRATADDLQSLCTQFELISAGPALARLQECLYRAGRIILAENKDWRILYIARPLNLPV